VKVVKIVFGVLVAIYVIAQLIMIPFHEDTGNAAYDAGARVGTIAVPVIGAIVCFALFRSASRKE
jgi:hypothetical protein